MEPSRPSSGPLAAKAQYVLYYKHMLKNTELRDLQSCPKTAKATALWDKLTKELNSFGPKYATRSREEWIYTFRAWRSHCLNRKREQQQQDFGDPDADDGTSVKKAVRPLSALEERAMVLWLENIDEPEQQRSTLNDNNSGSVSPDKSRKYEYKEFVQDFFDNDAVDDIDSAENGEKPQSIEGAATSRDVHRGSHHPANIKQTRVMKTTIEQFEIYLQHMRQHEQLRDFRYDRVVEANELWSDLADALNAVKKGPIRSREDWIKTLKGWKNTCAYRSRSENGKRSDRYRYTTALSDIALEALQLWAKSPTVPTKSNSGAEFVAVDSPDIPDIPEQEDRDDDIEMSEDDTISETRPESPDMRRKSINVTAPYDKQTVELLRESNRLQRAKLSALLRDERRQNRRDKLRETKINLLRRRDIREAEQLALQQDRDERERQRHELWMEMHSQRRAAVGVQAPGASGHVDNGLVVGASRTAQRLDTKMEMMDPLDICADFPLVLR